MHSRGQIRVFPRKSSLRSSDGVQRVRKSRVMKEIYAMQHYQGPLFRRLPFARVVKEIIEEQIMMRNVDSLDGYRIQASALEALQMASESFLVDMFAMC